MTFDPRSVVEVVRSVMGEGPMDMLPPNIAREDMDNATMCAMKDPVGYSYIEELERALVEAVGPIGDIVAVSSGTAALHLALLAAGVRPGDEVLVPAMAFAACAAVVRYCGAIPHFVDCRREPVGGINVFKLTQYLGRMPKPDRARIKAVIAVDLLGYRSVEYDLMSLCWNHEFELIEDGASALGSKQLMQARISTLSFNLNKIVTTGGGGAVLCWKGDDAEVVRHLATTAKVPSAWFYSHDKVGYNYRMANICAALGVGQVHRLKRTVARKRELARRYARAFFIPEICIDRDWNGWLNRLEMPGSVQDPVVERDATLRALTDAGYGCRAMFTPLHMLEPYKDCPRMPNLQCAEDIFNRTICLPSGVNSDEAQN